MTWLFETPVYILCWGALVTACFLAGWIQARHWSLACLAVGCALVTGSLVALEHYVVTPMEEVDLTLYEITSVLKSDHPENVLQHIHPEAEYLRQEATAVVNTFRFRRVSINNNREITVNTKKQPFEAKASFRVLVVGNQKKGNSQTRRVMRNMDVWFSKEGNRWKITDYKVSEKAL